MPSFFSTTLTPALQMIAAVAAIICSAYLASTAAATLLEAAQQQRDVQRLRLRLQGKHAGADPLLSGTEQLQASFWKRPLLGSEEGGLCQTFCARTQLGHALLQLFDRAGLESCREAVLQWWLLAAGVLMLLVAAASSALLALACAVLVVAGSLGLLQSRADKRRQALRQAIPDMLDELAQSLRAGRSFPQALRFVLEGQPADSPTNKLLRRLDADASLGRSCGDTLRELAAKTDLRELKSIAAVLDITAQIGGSAPALYEQVATSIRQDLLLNKKLKVQTAQGRSSVRLVGTVPFALIALMSLVMPGYLGQWLNTSGGQFLFALALCLVAVGFFWVRSVVNIRV
ncbi:MAG: type II secretion system F family protein [Coriobacteriia bacterium]|nr:type II secretion system F family protein [Coriobacteriia bacterium]